MRQLVNYKSQKITDINILYTNHHGSASYNSSQVLHSSNLKLQRYLSEHQLEHSEVNNTQYYIKKFHVF